MRPKVRNYIARITLSLFLCFPLQSVFSASRSNVWVHYKIKRGDNLTSIAKKYSVSLSAIMSWNKISQKNKIYIGQRIKIRQYIKSAKHKRKVPNKLLKSPIANLRIIKPYRAYGYAKHHGIVCKVSPKKAIQSSAKGSIVKIGYLRGYGDYILIDHGFGWHTLYSNIKERYVRLGQKVNAGDKIGTVMGQKLFFLISYRGKPVNPVKYLDR